MKNTNRNEQLDRIEQDYILALINSHDRFQRSYDCSITLEAYIQAIRIGIEHPELREWLADDHEKWWQAGGKPNDVYDIISKGVE